MTITSANVDCITEGLKAARLGLPEGFNPYEPDTLEHHFWQLGWESAYRRKPVRRAA